MKTNFIIIESNNKELTKTEVRKIVRDEIAKEFKKTKILNNKDIKKIVKDMMISQYKYFWEKRSFWSNNI
jgi:hypothetical protein